MGSSHNVTRVPMVDAVLFDLDGTLVDTIALILASFRHAMAEVVGEVPPDEVLLHNVGVPLRVQMEEFAPGHVDELLVVYREYNARVHDDLISEYAGTEEALESLGRLGVPMGVVTSKSGAPARRSLSVFGLERHFGTLVSSDDTQLHKPDPTPLLLGAQKLGVAPERCAYVGDSPHDMIAALGAGMLPIAALWGPFPDRVLEPGPAYAIPRLSVLPDVLVGSGEEYRAVPTC